MKPATRIVLLQKQLSIATKALKDIVNLDTYSQVSTAEIALEEIEHIQMTKDGMKPERGDPISSFDSLIKGPSFHEISADEERAAAYIKYGLREEDIP